MGAFSAGPAEIVLHIGAASTAKRAQQSIPQARFRNAERAFVDHKYRTHLTAVRRGQRTNVTKQTLKTRSGGQAAVG